MGQDDLSRVNSSLEFWIIALRLGFRVGFLDLGLEMSFGTYSHGSILEHSRLLGNNRAIKCINQVYIIIILLLSVYYYYYNPPNFFLWE